MKELGPTTKLPVQKSERVSFVDDERARKQGMPGYYKFKDDMIRERPIEYKFSKLKKTLMDKFKQTNEPSPVTYNITLSDNQTKESVRKCSISKYMKIDRMQEAELKKKKWVPGVGKYDI
jgi:type III secretory pathway component EscV